MKSFISWSGGKDASLSFYRAIKDEDVEAVCLLNMVSEDGKRSRTHGISSDLLKAQAEAMAIPIFQRKTSWDGYETEFIKMLSEFEQKEIQSGVFGDIDLDEHREWVERVCGKAEIEPIFPLWQCGREDLLLDFIRSGFKAVVVAVKTDMLSSDWLGRKIDESFIADLKKISSVDLCGEAGEYHTFVYDGPIFKKSVDFSIGEKIPDNKYCFLEVLPGKN
ncbi:MAG: diphthine--ammonia ligase [Dehalococcoidia bacterium]|nr:MAG: diphthine--ammonia ligase [Dehalococcoidia bacterium]